MSQHKESGETYLMYDQHPTSWDVTAIKETIDLISHEIYDKNGLISQ